MAEAVAAGTIVIALDPGRHKTGVALGNSITNTSRPLTTVTGDLATQITAVAKLCQQWSPSTIIVGLPDAQQAKAAHRYCQQFAQELTHHFTGAITFYAEDYTTQAARTVTPKDASVDAVAAAILAQDWLATQA